MKKRLFSMLLLVLLGGCSTPPSAAEMMIVRGSLQHFPSSVKSSKAWHGHNFMVGNTPVLPTADVSEQTLKEFIGQKVVVSGKWYPGEEWTPTPEDEMLSRPIFPNEISSKTSGTSVIIRGDGLKATSIQRLTGRRNDFNRDKDK